MENEGDDEDDLFADELVPLSGGETLLEEEKEEIIGEIVLLLQSPARNIISALKSSSSKLSGIIQTLSNREEQSTDKEASAEEVSDETPTEEASAEAPTEQDPEETNKE